MQLLQGTLHFIGFYVNENDWANTTFRRDTRDMTTFGSRLKAARLAQGLTQEQLAFQLGVSSAAISQWERDGTEPDFASLGAIRETLGTTLDALLFGDASDATEQEMLTAAERRLVQRFRKLSAKKRAAVVLLLDL
jgi:transcriptional regulator with XRE-family HTH domain